MRVIILMFLVSSFCEATCPLWTYPENHKLDQEVNNICQNITYPNITYATISSSTITTLTVTTETVTAETVKSLLTVPNGINATDAMAFGQLPVFTVSISSVSSAQSTTSTSFVQYTGQVVSIKPKVSTHHILVFTYFNSGISGTQANSGGVYELCRNGSTCFGDSTNGGGSINLQVVGVGFNTPTTMMAWDAPGTTSQTEYEIYFKSFNSNNTTSVGAGSGTQVFFIAMEVP